MARNVGDLWPFASGTSSLGAEQVRGPEGGFLREIRPFNHIHMNSGVWHDPRNGSSGVLRFDSKRKALGFSSDGGITFPLFMGTSPVSVAAAGSASIVGSGDLSIIASNELWLLGLNRIQAESDNVVQFISNKDDVTMQAVAGDIVVVAGRQVLLSSFNGSGDLNYQFGPFQSWHITNQYGGPFPIPHSGQIEQMILEGPGGTPHSMQAAYDGGPFAIVPDGLADIPLTIAATITATALRLGTLNDERGTPLNISGVTKRFAGGGVASIGDIRMHTSVFGADGRPVRGATTLDEKNALSLGPGTLSINCGSGIVPLAIASGVTTFVTLETPSIPTDSTGVEVNWNTAGNQVPDKFYTVTTDDPDIIINVPGLYKAEYVVSLNKTGGNLANTLETELLVNGLGVFGSKAFIFLRSSDDNRGTANGIGIFNANPGDAVSINIRKVNNFQQEVKLSTRECVLNLTYVGPPRGGITFS